MADTSLKLKIGSGVFAVALAIVIACIAESYHKVLPSLLTILTSVRLSIYIYTPCVFNTNSKVKKSYKTTYHYTHKLSEYFQIDEGNVGIYYKHGALTDRVTEPGVS